MAVALVSLLLAPAFAVDHIVGDAVGWTLNYPATWADGKIFKVGDNLVFTYPIGSHTVAEVAGIDFRSCNIDGNQINSWDSGNDTVPLDKAGRRWFVCTMNTHCKHGMKLLITVIDDNAPAPGLASPAAGPAGAAPSSAPLVGTLKIVVADALASAMLMF
ncbi:hypothetical protein CFC21_022789 [Triticum aestivum]|uniref:Phytocyanin domain-containing protein n=2 Tax=Triticum aestivum TaxID=4565 RepID=A0A9R1DZQ1_WHEAT|nr:hypothetical protein CFC21_016818 [Triticum aestivum]KAF7007906.1 hypothetical protein CFC21_022789 [Triticum aestivum]